MCSAQNCVGTVPSNWGRDSAPELGVDKAPVISYTRFNLTDCKCCEKKSKNER